MTDHTFEDSAQLPEPFPVYIRDDMIRLGQAIKLANVVEDGVEARDLITAGDVSVNGELETRRGRQLHPGDIITIEDADPDGGVLALEIVSED